MAPARSAYPRGTGPGVTVKPEPVALPIGRAEVIRDGTEIAVLGLGRAAAGWQSSLRHAGARWRSVAVIIRAL